MNAAMKRTPALLLGYMYDGARKEWAFRQTGLMCEVPALLGNIFIGRTKEGFSTNRFTAAGSGASLRC